MNAAAQVPAVEQFHRRAQIQPCPKCHRLRYGDGAHAPHHRRGVLVDCQGDEVRCQARSPEGVQCRLTAGHAGHHLARAEVANG